MMAGSDRVSDALVDAAWAVAQRRGVFGYAEIAVEAGLSERTVERILRQWQAAGVARVAARRDGVRRKLFELTPGTDRPDRPRGRTPEDNLWFAMRKLRSFTPSELALAATTDGIPVTTETAAAYCRALLASDHLSVARKATPGKREAIYRLVRETGPKPPRERRVRAIVDDNDGLTVLIGGTS